MGFIEKFYFQNICLCCFTFVICYSNVRYINWSLATTRGQSQREREYSNPAYSEVAMSSCDLTDGLCDINCCSDQDCSLEQKSSFTCIGGLHDGQKTESLMEENCEHLSETPYSEWVYLLCYVIKNSPYLGQYFVTQKKMDTLVAFSDSLVYKKDCFDFRRRTAGVVSDDNVFASYKYGSLIKVMYLNNAGVPGNGPRHLEMPANVLYPNGGVCIDSTPVRFLVNREAHCIRAISRNLCEKPINSPLSVQRHITAGSLINTLSVLGFLHVAMDSLGKNSVQVEQKFLCFSNGSDYGVLSNNVLEPNVHNIPFNSELFESQFSLSECAGSIEDILVTSYDEKEEVCRNVLISVSYDFVWKGTDILNLTATYILADVLISPFAFNKMKTNIDENTTDRVIVPKHDAVEQMEVSLLQHFVAKFRNYKSVKVLSGNVSDEEDTSGYSENPGYEVGHPVVALRKNDTSVGWEEVLLEVWGSDAECGGTKPLEFGYDIITSCRLEIGTENFEDCDSVRNQVQLLQESLVSGDFVRRGGAIRKNRLNISASEELVPILRVPYVNETAREDGLMVRNCSNIPSTLVADILYTTVPAHVPGEIPFHRIVGVRVGLQAVDWIPDISAKHQTFTLTAVVTFLPVPLVAETPKSRFWQLITAPDESETAWLNLFQIVDEFTTGDEMLEMSACGILLTVLALCVCILLRSDL